MKTVTPDINRIRYDKVGELKVIDKYDQLSRLAVEVVKLVEARLVCVQVSPRCWVGRRRLW